MTTEELRASKLLHERRLKFVAGKLASTRAEAHADGLVTTQEAEEIHRLEKRAADERALIARREKQLAAASPVMAGTRFLARAEKGPGKDAGTFVAAGAKIVWHTTEGSTVESAVGEYRKTGSYPHFTLHPKTGRLVQHVAMDLAARALRHPAGTVETNRAHAIQVELVGFAAQTATWDADDYVRIARLAREIEAAAGVPRKALATFGASARRLAPAAWLKGAGHCGHCHVPNNDHSDPGALRIDRVL